MTIRDFLIFQLELVLDGLEDVAVFNASILALVLDLVPGAGRRPRLFYSVLKLWLNLHGTAKGVDATDDGLFGASSAASDTLLGRLERMFRGGGQPRARRRPMVSAGGAG